MKLSTEAYNLIIEILCNEANNLEEYSDERKEIEEAMQELDTIGTY